ncbi:MAG: rhomboid family intramembrane serine protease [Alphaproteobacteria bacterium]|nr:rhomboid family intramembrane serine protease [Alphaproteobacteria bacterium]
MFLPIRDDNPHNTTPVVTWGLIGLCVAVFFWQQGLDPRSAQLAILSYGIIPADLFGTAQIDPMIAPLPAWMTIFTSMFMHGGWMHLGGNMLYLWIFGDNVEASMGRGKFLVFYLSCGLVAALTQSIAAPGSTVPMVGASGAVAGVLGAYLILHPRANIKVFMWLIIFITIINVPAWIVLGFWFLGQLMSQAGANPGEPGVAFLAHIGGFIAGVVLIFKMRKPGVPIFGKRASRAFAVETRRAVSRRRGGSVPSSGSDSKGPWS